MAALRLATPRGLSSLQRPPFDHKFTLGTRSLFTTSLPPRRTPIRTAAFATAFTLSAGLFAVYYFDARSAIHRYVFTPVLRYAFDAETGHKLAVKVLRSGLGPRDPVVDDGCLKVELWGHTITNPVGLAAGFDKDGEAIDGLFDLGFSWVEIGSVTPKPQPGNPRPRVFHLTEDSALINRYGFPSQGHSSVLARLKTRIPKFSSDADTARSFRNGSLLAVNLGKNKGSPVDSLEDFISGVRVFGAYADALVVNVSSPNTPGLRGLQNREVLENLLASVTQARDDLTQSNIVAQQPRILLKIAPDLDKQQLLEIAEVIRNSQIDGVIVSNTTTQRPSSLVDSNKTEVGGLSGAPLKPYSLAALRILRANLPASMPIIGCGGISTGADALEYAKAGASFVQVYTGFGYDGVGSCRRIKDQLVEALAKEGKTWAQVVRESVQKNSFRPPQHQSVKEKPLPENGGSIAQLIAEAEELKKMLDGFGEKFGKEGDEVAAHITAPLVS